MQRSRLLRKREGIKGDGFRKREEPITLDKFIQDKKEDKENGRARQKMDRQ